MDNKEAYGSSSSEDASSILNAMTSEGQKLAQKDPVARTKLISQARSLIAALETPMECVLQIIWANVRLTSL